MTKSFEQESYRLHKEHLQKLMCEDEIVINKKYNSSSVGKWRQDRFFKPLNHLKSFFPKSSWLTVGDAYGLDAYYLSQMFPEGSVLATDINDCLLKTSHRLGYISSYSQENAESISFPDGHFDFVLCKEALHHFPRPYMALYEMLRVARTGVILIEPYDQYLTYSLEPFGNLLKGLYLQLKHAAKYVLHRPSPLYEYERVNFVYHIMPRELIKIMCGVNLYMMSHKCMNDHEIPGSLEAKPTLRSPLFRHIWLKVKLHDLLAFLKLKRPNVLVACLFKKFVSIELEKQQKVDCFELTYCSRSNSRV